MKNSQQLVIRSFAHMNVRNDAHINYNYHHKTTYLRAFKLTPDNKNSQSTGSFRVRKQF